uniref:Uncharacterized protein n=1 Tax=Arundo donax TaxID=35708 RepID=A0A0A9C5S4_ARUDO
MSPTQANAITSCSLTLGKFAERYCILRLPHQCSYTVFSGLTCITAHAQERMTTILLANPYILDSWQIVLLGT